MSGADAGPFGEDPFGDAPSTEDAGVQGESGNASADVSAAAFISRTVTIVNRRGLHARAAAKLVNTVERFNANVEVLRDGQTVSARSIMGLMMLGAGNGSTVELRAEGWDAHEALEAAAGLIEAGFNEQD